MKIRLTTIVAVIVTVALTMSGCANSSGDSVDNQEIIENDIAGDNPDFDAQVHKMKQDIYEERLFEACRDTNAGAGVSDDDLITYCENNLYEYEDLGSGGGLPAASQIDEINDCVNGTTEIYILAYETPNDSGQVDAVAMCVQVAKVAASQQAPPGAFLIHVATA